MTKPTQAAIAAHLGLSVRALREYIAKGTIPKGATLDEARESYIKRLREVASNRAPTGPLDPAQEKARLDSLRADEVADRLALSRRELVPVAVYEQTLADALKSVAQSLESLPDLLERDGLIDGPAAERCQRVIDGLRDQMADRLIAATR